MGLFRSVDSRIPRMRPYDLDKLEKMVVKAHREYPAHKVTRLYDTKSAVCAKIVTAGGDNLYDLHHRKLTAAQS